MIRPIRWLGMAIWTEVKNRTLKPLLAMAAINTLRGYAIEVPAQVSVVGYDDTILASQFNPPLTTIRQPIDKAGAALVDALLDLIGGGQNKAHVLETELIVRGSAA